VQEKILILDFGSQYTQLIARRIREINVYCEIYPFNHFPVPDISVRGVILSGSPYSVRDGNSPKPDLSGIKGIIPLLGVCYGAQLLVQSYGGEVLPSRTREYGRANLVDLDNTDPFFKNIRQGTQIWMSHGDTIEGSLKAMNYWFYT
jgi:GMP synthase (glutamine-hydrolysing)